MDVTKIVYHIDDEDTPYLIKITKAPSKCTLKDFKNALPKSYAKYYFRDKDADFGVVKEEITNDSEILPNTDGTVKAWVVTLENSHFDIKAINRTKTQNIPVDFMSDDCTYQDSDSIYTTNGNNNTFNQMRFSKKPSRIHKLFQKRRHRYDMNSDTGNSNFDSEDDSSRFSSVSSYSKQRLSKHRRHIQRIERIEEDVSDQATSITDSTMSLTIITVTLNMDKANFLGISIVGQSASANCMGSNDGSITGAGIYIGAIMPNGAVALDGHIEVGDLLLEVNEISFEHMTNEQAVATLREQVKRSGPITLVVAKCWDPNPPSSHDSINGIKRVLDPSEPARPIDTRAWLAHTNAALRQLQEQKNMTSKSGSSVGTKSLPDLERVPIVPNLHGSQYIINNNEASINPIFLMSELSSLRAFLEELTFRDLLQQSNGSINVVSDLNHVIKLILLCPEPKLQLCDRTWLKMIIPSALLGSDLVDWTKSYVEGIASHKAAVKYVRNLVQYGYIKHPIGKRAFSLHCYYLFTDLSLKLCWEALSRKLDALLENQLMDLNFVRNRLPTSLLSRIPCLEDPLKSRLLSNASTNEYFDQNTVNDLSSHNFNWPNPPDVINNKDVIQNFHSQSIVANPMYTVKPLSQFHSERNTYMNLSANNMLQVHPSSLSGTSSGSDTKHKANNKKQ